MREVLQQWTTEAGASKYADEFGLPAGMDSVVHEREEDYFVSLVGELFSYLRGAEGTPADWSRLGNAFADFGFFAEVSREGEIPSDTALFSAAAFYLGGFPASASLMLAASDQAALTEGHLAAHELLARPSQVTSDHVLGLLHAVRTGDTNHISTSVQEALRREEIALLDGPEEWVGWHLYRRVIERFAETNIRAVLPPSSEGFWEPLVASFLRRTPPVWDFFPSQIEAISRGLASSDASYSVQMPTGAGKTALTETVIYGHLKRHTTDVAVLLVPYRALAAELRGSLVRRLNGMQINATALYGGTVPTAAEAHSLQTIRALVTTPETLSGVLSADRSFFSRISLVVCDEGHLLDQPARGVGLELLLARMRAQGNRAPRFVFVSAIVPNIEEINAWLGGSDDTVVRSDYRPAEAEFARLDSTGSGRDRHDSLRFHPHEDSSFGLARFLAREDFSFRNPQTGRENTYSFDSVKTRAIGAARKALQLGAVAVFAANKTGNQGCVGLAEELVKQLAVPLSLPKPGQFVRDQAALQDAVDYLSEEYGSEWIGTSALAVGAVVHHGDIPQETREVLEKLISTHVVGLAICTSTLAEGVNLPIRTIVLYSVQRRRPDGPPENLLARDIKNLVGRAGRPGSATRGLVICANAAQWPIIEPVARQAAGEPVTGALLTLMDRLRTALAVDGRALTNDRLEATPELHTLIDGIDATFIDLVAEEIGEDELAEIARDLAKQTYAAREASDPTVTLMQEVFTLRAQRILGIQRIGRIAWIRETGARPRMLAAVEDSLLQARQDWQDIADPADEGLVRTLVEWGLSQREVQRAVREVTRDEVAPDVLRFVQLWISGEPPREIARLTDLSIDRALAVHARVLAYQLQAVLEQGVALLERFLEARGQQLSGAVMRFPDHLRFGVPTESARVLMTAPLRHRRAAVVLGLSDELVDAAPTDRIAIVSTAIDLLADTDRWLPHMGRLVLTNTLRDLGAA